MLGKKKAVLEEAKPVEKAPPDYYDVVCLKRLGEDMWTPQAMPFPKKEDADRYADALREGNQGAVAVMPRYWM